MQVNRTVTSFSSPQMFIINGPHRSGGSGSGSVVVGGGSGSSSGSVVVVGGGSVMVVVVVGKMYVPEKNELTFVIWMKINRKRTHEEFDTKNQIVIVNMFR